MQVSNPLQTKEDDVEPENLIRFLQKARGAGSRDAADLLRNPAIRPYRHCMNRPRQ